MAASGEPSATDGSADTRRQTLSGKIVWTGRVITVLVSLLFFFSAAMKFMGGAEVKAGMAHLGLPESMIFPLGILEAACTVIYLIPATSVVSLITK
jgi:hypothetical protein